jgi:hypothetical protein
MGAEDQLRSSSREDEIADMSCGQKMPLRTVAYDWRHTFYAGEPLQRISKLKETVNADDDPSSVFPCVNEVAILQVPT